ncbi:MAG: hypothetical protein AB9903_06650 [Vulcanimicrobiota bacterium]
MTIKRMQEASQDKQVRELMEHRQKALHDEATRIYVAREKAKEDVRKESLAAGRAADPAAGWAEGLEKGKEKGMEKVIEMGRVQERQESLSPIQ